MDADLRDLLMGWQGEELDRSRADELIIKLKQDKEFRTAFVAEIRMLGMLHAVQSAEPRWLLLEDELGFGNIDQPMPMDEFQEQIRQKLLADPVRPWFRRRWIALAVAATILLIVLVFGLPISKRQSQPDSPKHSAVFAIVAKLEKVEWDQTRSQPQSPKPPLEGEKLGVRTLRLLAGRATLSLFNGVELFVEGPAEIELVTLDNVSLHRGKIRARVPQGAEGFSVSGPGLLVVDLGTEFSLNVNPGGVSQGKVFAGKVAAALLNADGNPSRTREFHQGQLFEINTSNGQIDTITESEPFATPPNFVPPPLNVGPSYVAEVFGSRPWSYWRFESQKDSAISNEIAGRPLLRATGPIHLNGNAGTGRSAQFSADQTGQFLAMDGLWQPPRTPGFAVEFWFQSNSVSHSSLLSLVAPKDTNHHYFLLETTCRQRTAMRHPPDLIRLLYRWPTGRDGGVNLYSTNPYLPYRWHHLVGQLNKDQMEVILDGEYLSGPIMTPLDNAKLSRDRRVDGETLTLKSVIETVSSKPCQLVLGRLSTVPQHTIGTSRPFAGQIDEVAIYERPLTIEEIRRHIQAKPPAN